MNLPPLPMEISSHALERWAERVRQDDAMRPRSARIDMERCAQTGTLQADPPPWMHVYDQLYLDQIEYLMLGDDIAMVVRRVSNGNLVVMTVMTRHDPGGVHAASLRARRKARRAAQHPPPTPGSLFPPRSYDEEWRTGMPRDPDDV